MHGAAVAAAAATAAALQEQAAHEQLNQALLASTVLLPLLVQIPQQHFLLQHLHTI
jgi:cell division inhibitor SulA